MKKIYIEWSSIWFYVLILIMASSLVCFIWFGFRVFKDISNETIKYKSNIGKYIVIEGDTLLVVDASMIQSSYTLSSGLKIDNKLFDKLVIKE